MSNKEKITANRSLFIYLDIFGVSFNFLVEGGNKKKTMGGAILSLIYGFIFIGLFFGFGIDLYQRKRPKVSFSTVIDNYKEIPLSNNNFTYAYRVEDQLGKMITDESLIYNIVGYFKFSLVNGTWIQDFQKILDIKKCRELPNIKEKENYYNTSLNDWNCIDFDNITLGGNWDGNFVYGILINTYQCSNLTNNRNCYSQDFIKKSFQNDLTSNNLFFSQMSMEVLPSMDDFENPLKTTLVNNYQILNLGLTKRKVNTFKSTKMKNDVGWFFSDVNEFSLSCGDSILDDFSFKDTWSQDILYNQFLYYGKKQEIFNRSYTKIQEVFAAIGGFAKFFYFTISLLFLSVKKVYSNIFLMNNFIFDNIEEESSNLQNKFRSFSENKGNIVENLNQTHLNCEVKQNNIPQNSSTQNKDNSVQIDNYLNDKQKISHTAKNNINNFDGKNETNSNISQNQHKINNNLAIPEINPIHQKHSVNVISSSSANFYKNIHSFELNKVNPDGKKLSNLEYSNLTFFEYFKYRCICVYKNFKYTKVGTKLNTYVLCEKYYTNKLDILSYFEIHNQFNHFKKFFLEKQDRKLIKYSPLNLNKYDKKNSLSSENKLMKDLKNIITLQQQVLKPESQSDSNINLSQLAD